jgi:23S rRNA pseudouridine1911/1915/1917 synthase
VRLDRRLRELLPTWTNSERAAALASRRVSVNHRVVWLASWDVDEDAAVRVDGIVLEVPLPSWDHQWVVFADDRVVVLNKPAGIRPEPRGPVDRTDILSGARSVFGPELVAATRLDRDTSGIMILSFPGKHRADLQEALRTHTITKSYAAIVPAGLLPHEDSLTIRYRLGRDPDRREAMRVVDMGGQSAVTELSVVDRLSGRIELRPKTGRTHQLRVHLSKLGCPIIGDVLYGGQPAARLMLHAARYQAPTLGLDVACDCPF